MKYRRATQIFIMLIIMVIASYDIFVLTAPDGGTESSISHVLLSWSYRHPVLPFSFGFIMGHLFWRIKPPPRELDEKI